MFEDSLDSAALAVVGVARHFELLKSEALLLQATLGATQRGYFTPSEEEETRHLLVSYWQARCALMELLASFRLRHQMSTEVAPDVFVVAFAAAVVLVDAARLLRDSCGQNRIIREKMNEPDQTFGIPAGVYDTVQQSLTDPFHAMDLLWATQYFYAQRSKLQAATQGHPPLEAAWAVLEPLVERVRVPVTRYAAVRWNVRRRQAVDYTRQAFGRMLFRMQRGVSLAISAVSLQPGHRPALPADIVDQICRLAQPGDVFITRKDNALTNYFLPGYWPHASLYLGDAPGLAGLGVDRDRHVEARWSRLVSLDPQRPQRVLEALKDGVWLRSAASPFASDALTILRPRLEKTDVARALARGIAHEGKPYDFDFDFTRSERLVCTEVVYRSYDGIGPMRFKLTRRAGRLTLSAEDLIGMALRSEGFEPVAVFTRDWSPRLVQGGETHHALRATCRTLAC